MMRALLCRLAKDETLYMLPQRSGALVTRRPERREGYCRGGYQKNRPEVYDLLMREINLAVRNRLPSG